VDFEQARVMAAAGYELRELVREGRRTSVYRARRLADQRSVVLKCLRSDHTGQREAARLRREFEILSRFDHDNVVRAYGLERIGSGLALVLEDFGGGLLVIAAVTVLFTPWGTPGARLVDPLRAQHNVSLQPARDFMAQLEAAGELRRIAEPVSPHLEMTALADRVLVVDVSEQTQLARTMRRDANDEAQVRAIIAAQIDRAGRLESLLGLRPTHRRLLLHLGSARLSPNHWCCCHISDPLPVHT